MAVRVEGQSAVQDACRRVCLSWALKRSVRHTFWIWKWTQMQFECGLRKVTQAWMLLFNLSAAAVSPCRGTCDAGKAGRDGKGSDRQDGVVTPLLWKRRRTAVPRVAFTNWNLSFIPVLLDEWGSCWQNKKCLFLYGSDTFRSLILGSFIFFHVGGSLTADLILDQKDRSRVCCHHAVRTNMSGIKNSFSITFPPKKTQVCTKMCKCLF